MKKLAISLIITSLFLLVACQNDSKNVSSTGTGLSVNTPQGRETNATPADPFLNFDELERYGIVTGTSKEYTEDDLRRLVEDNSQKDYVVVIKNFVRQELGQEISYLDTVDGTFNPRSVVVGTAQGKTYLFDLQKWYNHNDIWTVNRYAEYKDQMAVAKKESTNYELIEPTDIKTETIQKQILEKISAATDGHYYFKASEKLYILLIAGKDQSVELLHVFGNDNDPAIMDIEYTYTTNQNEQFGEKPYVLLAIDSDISDLFLKSTLAYRQMM